MILTFLTTVFSHEYLIKISNENLFLQGPESAAGLPSLGSRKDANSFIIENTADSRKVLIYVKELPNQVLDIANGSTKLIFYPKHGLTNQQFEIVPLDFIRNYRIMQNGQCLGYSPDERIFRIEACVRGNSYQIFEFICIDCPGKKSFMNGMNTTTNIDHNHFLDEATQKLIQNIGKLVVDMNTCFSENGTCKSTDYSHIQLFCTDPFSNDIHEVWPDLKNDFTHREDGGSDPLSVDTDNYEFLHNKSIENDNHLRHLDSEHARHVLEETDPADHVLQNEDLYHSKLIKSFKFDPKDLVESPVSGKFTADIKNPTAFLTEKNATKNKEELQKRDPVIIVQKDQDINSSDKILDTLKSFFID